MSAERHRLAKEIFADALEKAEGTERAAWLAQACGDDVELRHNVEDLLRAYEKAGTFLEEPAASPLANADSAVSGRNSVPLTEKPGDTIGRYKLLEQIGEGGCGVVYMAEQAQPIRRKVALKVLKLGMDTKLVIARFEAERQALALMDHPNIARVLDAGATETGRPYFVMELVRGIRITDYCDENNLTTEQRLDLFSQVCHAIQHAHQKGIIHRDIKPSNILVTVVDGKAVPKVIDFGIAKATGGQALTDKTVFTAFEQFIGTPAYMSPEQAAISGVDVDTRSDIYSLGVLLYELLTGHTPFDPKTLLAAGLDEMRRIIRESEPPRPSTRLSNLDGGEQTTVAKRRQAEPPRLIHLVRGDLDWIVMKCLEKDRKRRYETANLLTLDVENHLRHRPVTARQASLGHRLTKFIRRNRVAVGVGSVVALAVLAGITALFIGLARAEQAEARERLHRQAAEASAAEAREQLAVAYLAQARLARQGLDIGRREAVLDLVARAAATRVSPELRSQAASALGLINFKVMKEWSAGTILSMVAVDQIAERYARSDDLGNVSVRRISDDVELFQLPGRGVTIAWVFRFSPDNHYLAATDSGPPPGRLRVWDLTSRELVLDEPDAAHWAAVDFRADSRMLASADRRGHVTLYDLKAHSRTTQPTASAEPHSLRFSPDGSQFAISADDRVCLYDAAALELTRTLTHSNAVTIIAWSPDGRWLAAPAGRNVYLWDMSTGGVLERVLEHHTDVVSSVEFDPRGELLCSTSWDGTTIFYSCAEREIFGRYAGSAYSFVGNGKHLVGRIGGLRIALIEIQRVESRRIVPASLPNTDLIGSFSPDDRWLVLPALSHLQCWDTATWQMRWSEPVDQARAALFRPDGQMLVTLEGNCVRARELRMEAGELRPGTPRDLFSQPGSLAQAKYSADGSVLVFSQRDHLNVLTGGSGLPQMLPMRLCNFVGVSPDGRYAGGISWGDPLGAVWDLSSGKVELTLATNATLVEFSPDGQWLLTGDYDRFQVLRTGTWVKHAERRREPSLSHMRGLISSDSRWAVVDDGSTHPHLCRFPSLEPILTLETARERPVALSPGGRFLLTRRTTGQFCVWDIENLRGQLRKIGLDW